MDIILISHSRGQTWKLRVMPRSLRLWLPVVLLSAAVVGGCLWLGYQMAPEARGVDRVLAATEVWDQQVADQREEIASLRQRMDNNIHALAKRLGRLQAHVTRLNAVGSRMTQMADLDAAEFDFDRDPPLGGPEAQDNGPTPSVDEFNSELDNFSRELDARERQMRVLRDLMVAGELRDEVMPSGRPIESGWLSSGYGMRTDPFTGRRSLHPGIDFASRLGADVVSVAAGVVSFVGRRGGYGILVEINHGNGYVTRYGHNEKPLVKVGERVDKGQVIARMGSTGRSTGPHVHFEVLRNGRVVNPTEYIRASR